MPLNADAPGSVTTLNQMLLTLLVLSLTHKRSPVLGVVT